MLSIGDPRSWVRRRSFLQAGSLALGGLSLPGLAKAAGGTTARLVNDRAVVFVFMHGGPSQIETFDPKMEAPKEIRSATGAVATRIPGVSFGSSFPKLADMADRLAVVRSYVPGDANHDIKPLVCRDTFGTSLGSLYSRVAGMNHPQTAIPTSANLFPQSVDASTQPAVTAFGRFDATGIAGGAFAPFAPGGGGNLQRDMRLALPLDRLEDRRGLLSRLDRVKWALEEGGAAAGMDGIRQQAYSTILGGVADAFDLSREDPRTVARYDTAPLVPVDSIDKKWNNHKNYADNAKSLGKLMLLARRMVERGCGFVTVTTNFVWDMHHDSNNAGVAEGFRYMGQPFDHAISAFLEDLEARGMADDVLLVCCGEMGRTPRLDNNGGRNHWGNLGPLMLAGGGLPMGQVIGQSARDAGEPSSSPVRIQNLIATILQYVMDVGRIRIERDLPRDLTQTMTGWEAIPELS